MTTQDSQDGKQGAVSDVAPSTDSTNSMSGSLPGKCAQIAANGVTKIALAGFGNVGREVYKMILSQPEMKVVSVCTRVRHAELPKDANWTSDFSEMLASDADIVVELIGGNTDAYCLIKSALEGKKHVVTANKLLLFTHGDELAKLADENGVKLLFEAAVCGGMPVINNIKLLKRCDKILKISGILNGTCNYVLTEMDAGGEYASCLEKAKALGYAEADATFDVSGADASQKAFILHKIAFGFEPEVITFDGIANISSGKISALKAEGLTLKLISTITPGKCETKAIGLKCDSPFTKVNSNFNAVHITFKQRGEVSIIGQGAGGLATATSVIADIMDAIDGRAINHFGN